jgi:hypothetical protein
VDEDCDGWQETARDIRRTISVRANTFGRAQPRDIDLNKTEHILICGLRRGDQRRIINVFDLKTCKSFHRTISGYLAKYQGSRRSISGCSKPTYIVVAHFDMRNFRPHNGRARLLAIASDGIGSCLYQENYHASHPCCRRNRSSGRRDPSNCRLYADYESQFSDESIPERQLQPVRLTRAIARLHR